MTQDLVLQRLLSFAKSDENVRTVLLEGSRANPDAKVDEFSDYDIAFVTRSNQSYLSKEWFLSFFSQFGKIVISQMPDNPNLFLDAHDPLEHYAYLVQFSSGLRLDITLETVKFIQKVPLDSAAVVLLDKDENFFDIEPNNSDFYVKRPKKNEFLACCNEFWWTSLYIAKALKRKQIIGALELMNTTIRLEFVKMLTWLAGVENNFADDVGKYNTDIGKYISKDFYHALISSYSCAKLSAVNNAFISLLKNFPQISQIVANSLSFNYDLQEGEKTLKFLKEYYGVSLD
ncbi:MAG: aminoglycoside 6-adenylyltransferase [Lactobacillales bacterium]|nr:aminoglycoside 6-adenylyltransferase [Lactobacillales bacterium]